MEEVGLSPPCQAVSGKDHKQASKLSAWQWRICQGPSRQGGEKRKKTLCLSDLSYLSSYLIHPPPSLPFLSLNDRKWRAGFGQQFLSDTALVVKSTTSYVAEWNDLITAPFCSSFCFIAKLYWRHFFFVVYCNGIHFWLILTHAANIGLMK